MEIIKNKKGQSLIEYLIIVALVAVGTISIMRTMSAQVQTRYARIAESLGASSSSNSISNQQLSDSMYKKHDLKDFFNGSSNSRNSSNGSGNRSNNESNTSDSE